MISLKNQFLLNLPLKATVPLYSFCPLLLNFLLVTSAYPFNYISLYFNTLPQFPSRSFLVLYSFSSRNFQTGWWSEPALMI